MLTEISTSDASGTIFACEDDHILHSQEQPLLENSRFDGDQAKYHCCKCHVWVCTLIVGVVELMCLVLTFIGTVAAYGGSHKTDLYLISSDGSFGGGVVGASLGVLVVGLLVHGVLKQRREYLIPHLMAQVFAMLGSAVAATLFAISAVVHAEDIKMDPSSLQKHHQDLTYAERLLSRPVGFRYSLIISLLLAVLTVMEGAFFIVVYRCYRYLKDIKERHEKPYSFPLMAIKTRSPEA